MTDDHPRDDSAGDSAAFDVDNLAAILKREYQSADSYYSGIAQLQRQAFEYYEAQPFGNEIEGRSQVILPDVQETIDYMTQSVLRTFISGDRAVEFEAIEEGDEEAAEEATAAVNFIFMRRQDGYRILHDAVIDGLLRKTGIFKTVSETVEKISRETLVGLPDQLALLENAEGVEIEDVAENDDGTVTAKIKHQRSEKRFVDYALPVSEFRFSPAARNEEDADYLCHVSPKTRSDLIEMGFDRDQVEALPGYSETDTIDPRESDLLDNYTDDESSPILQKVLLCEEYARIDVDGDGIAERVKVYRVENEILVDAETGEPSIETVDDQPFAVFCPYPRPHHLVGYSVADKVMDLQLYRSFVARQLFDGLAFSNMPRQIVDTNMADADTYADILAPIPGSPIRIKGGAGSLQPLQTGFDVGKSMQALEWITGERESRTGITRLNQGLDADALNKTATGTALMQAQGQQQEEYVARNLAEALSRLFVKKYRLMRAEGEPFSVKVDGQYRQVDPTTWPDDINLTVRVGLGSGSKDKRIQYYMAMMQPMAEGFSNGLVSKKHTYTLIDKMARDMGIGDGDDFWIDPDNPPEQGQQEEEKPDPEAQAEAAKIKLEQQKSEATLQLKREEAEASLVLEQQKSEAQISALRDKHSLEMEQKREAALLDSQLARDKADTEAQIALYKIDKEAQIARYQANVGAAADANISENRPGGDLDA